MAKKRDYFGFSKNVSLILAIIPITSVIFGFFTRLSEGKVVAALLRVLLGWNIIWILDIVLMLFSDRILRVLDV